MQLKLTRSQREGGVIATSVLFCLDARAELTAEERSNVLRYKLGKETIYSSETAKRHADKALGNLDQVHYGSQGQRWGGLAKGLAYAAMSKLALNITIDSLQRGHHIECKDLNEVIATENALYEACENFQEYLTRAATFDGRETTIVFTKDGTLERPADPSAVPATPFVSAPAIEAAPSSSPAALSYDAPASAAGPSFAASSATMSDNSIEPFVEKFKYWWAYRTSGQRIFFVIACLIVVYIILKAL